MTSEVIVMNRHAITLAADSAVTVERYIPEKGKEERYFKGANKIFQMSSNNPVGLMIYGNSSLEGMPWEIVVKDFRDVSSKETSFSSLPKYAEALFSYLSSNINMFPAEKKLKIFEEHVKNAAQLILYLQIIKDDKINAAIDLHNDEEDISKRPALNDNLKLLTDEFLSNLEAYFDTLLLSDAVKGANVDQIIETNLDKMKVAVADAIGNYISCVDTKKLTVVAIKSLFKNFKKYMNPTGVVVAGYGEEDYFPGYAEYSCYGFLLDHFIFELKEEQHIDFDTESAIQPFAQSRMTETFMHGFTEDIFSVAKQSFRSTAKELAEAIKAHTGSKDSFDALIEAAEDTYNRNWVVKAYQNHAIPLLNVIASLPIDEMANLSETFIMLESLKEKVTRPTEQVGGPIDVAVITKNDGFIWIKRKHYFDAKLNPRYFTSMHKS